MRTGRRLKPLTAREKQVRYRYALATRLGRLEVKVNRILALLEGFAQC